MAFTPFDTCRLRTERAALHSKTLAELWRGLETGSAYTTRIDFQDDGAGEIFVQPVDPDWFVRFSLQYGEMLYQLRAALDSCVYDAAVLHTGKNPPDKEDALMFPICISSEKFKESARRIKPLPNELRSFVESVQPYQGTVITNNLGEWRISEILGILSKWSIIDRHRRLHVVGTLPTRGMIGVLLPPGMTLEYVKSENGCTLEHESKIGTCKIGNFYRGPKIGVNAQLIFEIAVKDGPEIVLATSSGPAMLIACWEVMGKFKKFFGIA